MAVVTKTYTPANVIQGPADLYIGVAAPASSLTPTADANNLTLDANGQPTDTGTAGFHVGSIEAPSQLQVTEKFNEIRDDQHESPIDLAFDTVEAEIDVTIKEVALLNVQKYFMSDKLSTRTALAAQDVLQVGGQLDSSLNLRTLLLVQPRRDAAGKFVYVMAYKSYLKSALQLTFHRNKENVFKLKFGCVMDSTRVAGDEVLQVVRTK